MSTRRHDRTRRALLARALATPLLMPTVRRGGVTLTSLASGVLAGLDPGGLNRARAAGCGDGPRSLVCLFLAGGADTFNVLVPSDARYDEYRTTRGDLAVPESELADVGALAGDASGATYALHTRLPTLERLQREGRLAVVANVGPLLRPTTRADYLAGRALPESLFAHDAQQKLWQTANGRVSGASGFGWGGALAERLAQCNAGGGRGVGGAFSLDGANAWQAARDARFTALNPNVAIERLYGLDPTTATWIEASRRTSVAAKMQRLLADAMGSDSPMAREAAGAIETSLVATDALDGALENEPLDDWRPDARNKLEVQLHRVARLIAARETLGHQRQLFFVRMGGWDTHSNQNERQPILFDALERALAPFQATLDERGLADSVTSFTASDFGRTLAGNGNGTDHGWGGHAFVFGGAVAGTLAGRFPSYASAANPDDASTEGDFAGRLIPTTSVNQYGATLARWMGVEDGELDAVFPDLANFAVRDLGLFGGA